MNRIRELRKEKGISMKILGEAIGVAESTISLYETEKRMPDADTLKKLARYFGVSIDNLLGESNSVSDEFTETLYRRPGMRILFDAAKDAPDEVLQKTADLLEAMKNRQVK